MSIKTKHRQLNGSPLMSTGELMNHLEQVMPSETLKENNILPSNSNTEVEPKTVQEAPSNPKAKKKRKAQPDTGHNINYDNFGQLIYFVTDIGTPPFDPPGRRLPLVALQALHTEANLALQDLQEKEDAETTARNLRQSVFAPVESLGAQVRGQLVACGADKKVLKDFRTFMNEFTGKRAKAIDPNDGNKHISASHTKFANRIWAWNGIATLCSGFPDYESRDPALAPEGLNAVKDAMVSSNAAVQAAISATKMARKHRDKVFYKSVSGLVPVALDVKEYVKALFGYKSPEFRMVNHLKFKNLMGK